MPNAKKEKCNVNNTNIQIQKVIPKMFYLPSIKLHVLTFFHILNIICIIEFFNY